MGMGKKGKLAVSLLLMVILLAVFLWNTDLSGVWEVVRSVNWGWLAAAVALALTSYWIRAIRWGLILAPVGKARHSSLVMSTAAGYAIITLLPARVGDLARALLLARRDKLPASGSLASILTERVFDTLTVVFALMLFLLKPAAALESSAPVLAEMRRWAWGAVAVLVAFVAVLFGLFEFQERFVTVVARPFYRLGDGVGRAVSSLLHHFLEGLKVIKRPRDLVVVVFFSLLVWWTIFLQVKATLLAFGLSVPLRVTYGVVALTVLGLSIPTPAGVGSFHAAAKFALMIFVGASAEVAAGIALVYHAICFLPITLLGLLSLAVMGASLSQVAKGSGEVGPAPAGEA